MRIAKECLNAEPFVQAVMVCKLGPIVECNRCFQVAWQGGQEAGDFICHVGCGFIGDLDHAHDARGAFMQHQKMILVFRKRHQIGFPVAGFGTLICDFRSFIQGSALFDEFGANRSCFINKSRSLGLDETLPCLGSE